MELEDLIPDTAEFKLSKMDVSLTLRPPNLEDRVIFQKKFGAKGVQIAFQNSDWEVISFVVLHLLTDRSAFAARDLNEQSVDGETVSRRVLGPELFRKQVHTLQDQTDVLRAINSAFANSDPDIKKVVEDELKKKGFLLTPKKSAGESSLTNSLANTDGVPSTSSQEP
jgi:hypothetical protein